MAKRARNKSVVPEHKMGQHTGYSTDGTSYWPAPTHTQPMEAILEDEQAVKALLEAVTNHATRLLAQIAGRKRRWWLGVQEDLGLDKSVNWSYSADGRIFPSANQPDDDETAKRTASVERD